MKWVKFGVSRHFLENPLRKWPGILHADVSWAYTELSRLWSQFIDFSHFGSILTSWNWSNLGILLMLCGFSSLWWPLTETGNIWGFWALSGERVGINVEGGAGHISDALRRVLSRFPYVFFFGYPCPTFRFFAAAPRRSDPGPRPFFVVTPGPQFPLSLSPPHNRGLHWLPSDFGHFLTIFPILVQFWVRRVKFEVSVQSEFLSRTYPWKEWPEISHAYVSWPHLEVIRF